MINSYEVKFRSEMIKLYDTAAGLTFWIWSTLCVGVVCRSEM